MRPLDIEFRPQRRLPSWVSVVALVVLLPLLGFEAWRWWSLNAQAGRVLAKASELQALLQEKHRQANSTGVVVATSPLYFADARALWDASRFDHGTVLRALEAPRVPGVKVQAIELTSAEGTATVELEVSGQEALLKYVEELNRGEDPARWSVSRTQGATASSQATATITSAWR